jgi:hypothetical protein
LTGPSRVDGEPEFNDVEADVFVKAVKNELAHSIIVPCSMDEEQFGKKVELKSREICI